MSGEIWTIGKLLKWTEEFFQGRGIESPRVDAEVLLADVLKQQRIYLYVHFDEPMEADELAAYRAYVKQRANRVPVSQILGYREFMGLHFKVTADTLTPRPDTETLVETALELLKERERPFFADIGTGTGAICLSILHELKQAHAVTVDISEKARAVAEENAAFLGLTERIEFLTGDLLAPLEGQKFDAILSNPPYISEADMRGLAPEVREKEPGIALIGGVDGLDYYRRLIDGAADYLNPGGFLAVEVGIHQAEQVQELAAANSSWGRTEIHKDYAGISRVVVIYLA